MKKLFIILIGLTALFLTACSPQPLQTIGATKYYVEIDGAGQPNDDEQYTRYEYNLTGYNKDGESKELYFTAGKELRENAYLMIYAKKDKIITYEEVAKADIPDKAKELLE